VYTGLTRWYAPIAVNIIKIIPRLVTAADADVVMNILKNGATATTLTITAGQTTGSPFTGLIAMAAGDYITINITQVGSTSAPGRDLYVQIQYAQL
jgi:hypothetical protein